MISEEAIFGFPPTECEAREQARIQMELQEYTHPHMYHMNVHTHTQTYIIASRNYKQIQLIQTPLISVVLHFFGILHIPAG